MRRINNGDEYYAFPGGGVEKSESKEEAVRREIKEETTVEVGVRKLLYKITWDTGDEYYFYLCDYHSGEPSFSSDASERTYVRNGNQTYEPLWVPLDAARSLRIFQLEIRDLLLEDIKDNFVRCPRELSIKLSERRQQ